MYECDRNASSSSSLTNQVIVRYLLDGGFLRFFPQFLLRAK